MSGQMMFELFNNYYGLPDYADEFIRAALFGKSGAGSRIPFDFTGKPDIFRVECAQKASAYWSGESEPTNAMTNQECFRHKTEQ